MISKPFPKIWALGHRHTKGIFDSPVEITEKIDGSQFGFGRSLDGDVVIRSKGREIITTGSYDKLFAPAIEQVMDLRHLIPDGVFLYGETLSTPRHNVLKYNRVPEGHVALFGVYNMEGDIFVSDWQNLSTWSAVFEMEVVPLLYSGMILDIAHVEDEFTGPRDRAGATIVMNMLERESILGGTNIEGVVVKNYAHDIMIDSGQYIPMQMGKYVSEAFKEKAHPGRSDKTQNKVGVEQLMLAYKTEARWRKAVQHLRDDGKLLGEPKDIGELIKLIKSDWYEEEKDDFKRELFNIYSNSAQRIIISGFPEWYKKQLALGEVQL